jgi:hypothetical protein
MELFADEDFGLDRIFIGRLGNKFRSIEICTQSCQCTFVIRLDSANLLKICLKWKSVVTAIDKWQDNIFFRSIIKLEILYSRSTLKTPILYLLFNFQYHFSEVVFEHQSLKSK